MKGVVFDLDGTLVSSTTDIALSVNYTLKKLHLPDIDPERIAAFIGDGIRELILRSLGPGNEHLCEEALSIYTPYYNDHLLDHTTCYPEVQQTLESLVNQHKLFVLSNKREVFSRKILEGLHLSSLFQEIAGGDTYSERKPHPMALLHFAEKHGISPAQLFMVGDNHTDIEAGKRAGARTIFCTYGIGKIGSTSPDLEIASFAELKGIL